MLHVAAGCSRSELMTEVGLYDAAAKMCDFMRTLGLDEDFQSGFPF
jgi:hypothetical protein